MESGETSEGKLLRGGARRMVPGKKFGVSGDVGEGFFEKGKEGRNKKMIPGKKFWSLRRRGRENC